MSEKSRTDGIKGTVGSVYGLLRILVTGVLALAFLLGWAGFWVVVTRIHYLHQDWMGVVVTAALGLAPVVASIVWVASDSGLRTRVGETIDVFTPSSTASTSRD